jgi:hypothetical protein
VSVACRLPKASHPVGAEVHRSVMRQLCQALRSSSVSLAAVSWIQRIAASTG